MGTCTPSYVASWLVSAQFVGTPRAAVLRPKALVNTCFTVLPSTGDNASASQYQFIETEMCMCCAVLLPRFVRLRSVIEM